MTYQVRLYEQRRIQRMLAPPFIWPKAPVRHIHRVVKICVSRIKPLFFINNHLCLFWKLIQHSCSCPKRISNRKHEVGYSH